VPPLFWGERWISFFQEEVFFADATTNSPLWRIVLYKCQVTLVLLVRCLCAAKWRTLFENSRTPGKIVCMFTVCTKNNHKCARSMREGLPAVGSEQCRAGNLWEVTKKGRHRGDVP
jgi:hypothetical protein